MYHELLVDDHLADDAVHHGKLQLKHLRQSLHTERERERERVSVCVRERDNDVCVREKESLPNGVIHTAVGKKVGPQRLLLDFPTNKHQFRFNS